MKRRDILIAKLTVALAVGIVLVEFVGHPSDGPRIPVGHLSEHVLLFTALMLPVGMFRPDWMISMVPLACFFAIGMELLRIDQSHVHGYDVIADIFGIILVIVTVPLLRAIGAFIASSWE